MKAWPVQPRDGFTGFPNEVLARAIGQLTADQFRLFAGLVYAAEFKREGSTSPCGRWRIGWAQVLVSYEGLATTYGLTVDAVRRALRRFEGVAVATSHRASPATPSAISGATPPTLVDFGSWYGIQAPAVEPATPSATPPATLAATSPAPIQHRNTGTPKAPIEIAAAPVRVVDDYLAGRRLEVVDVAGDSAPPPPTWQGASDFRLKLERKLMVGGGRYSTAALSPADWAELDELVAWAGGAEKAATWCAERVKDRRSGSKRVTQLRFFQVMLRTVREEESDARPSSGPREAPPAAAPVSDAKWGKVLAQLKVTLRPDLYARWMAPLKATVNGAVQLEAPSAFDAAFLRDQWAEPIADVVEQVLGQRLEVVLLPESGR